MSKSRSRSYKVAVVWRGDCQARVDARPETSRLKAIFESLRRHGMEATPAVYSEAMAGEVREQLLATDGVLVWVDPIAAATGGRRRVLDGILREAAAKGVFVSSHPDVTAKMGVKSVLYRTRGLGWGTDTHLYESRATFEAGFPGRLATGARVLKRNHGNGGIGVWKVEAAGEMVRVQEAAGGAGPRIQTLGAFMADCAVCLEGDGALVDQPFQARHLEGMVRCYMSGERVVGFGHQWVRALAPPEAGPAGQRIYSAPTDARFQRLRALMEQDWTPGLSRLLDIDPGALPVIWDADFLLGPKTATAEDSYVLCEINVSSVFPIPDEAPEELAKTTLRRLATMGAPRGAPSHPARPAPTGFGG